MQEKKINISKTSRYYTLGQPGDGIEHIWLVCHGYGFLASDFMKHFRGLDNGRNYFVAPEGLSRFYLTGVNGKVGACWMTKEDRLNDIKDCIGYLDAVYKEVMEQFGDNDATINVLGFSQGAATVCRWLANGKSKADNLILWAGVFPPDMDFEVHRTIFNSMNVWIVAGNNDEFVGEEEIEKQKNMLAEHQVDYELIRFQGKHEMNQEVLEAIVQKL